MRVEVIAPRGSYPGMVLRVRTAAGTEASVRIPQGVQPGQRFYADISPEAPPAEQRPSYARQQSSARTTQPGMELVDMRPRSQRSFSSVGGGSAPPPPTSSNEERSTGSPIAIGRDRPCCDESCCYKCVICPIYLPFCLCCLTRRVRFIHTAEVGMVEKFGSYRRTAEEGEVLLYAPCGDCSACCNEVVAKRVSLRAKELSVRTVCKTKDNVFVTVEVVVIYRVPDSEAAYDAAYKLTSIKEQLGDYVEDVLRSHIASFSLDEVFLVSKQLADTVEARTEERFRSYGYELDATLVTGIEPDARVKESMNQINASRRTKEAQVHLAEANKAIDVKRAEARAEVVYLQGVGVARMREAIMQGMKETIEDLDDASQSSTNPTDILLTLQHMEALEKIAEAQKAKKNSNNAGPAAQQPLFLPIGVDSIGAVRRRLHAFLSNVVDKSTSPPQGYFSLV